MTGRRRPTGSQLSPQPHFVSFSVHIHAPDKSAACRSSYLLLFVVSCFPPFPPLGMPTVVVCFPPPASHWRCETSKSVYVPSSTFPRVLLVRWFQCGRYFFTILCSGPSLPPFITHVFCCRYILVLAYYYLYFIYLYIYIYFLKSDIESVFLIVPCFLFFFHHRTRPAPAFLSCFICCFCFCF